jgi:uncharacterized metal-binding protein
MAKKGKSCSCGRAGGVTLVLACSGASNVGQITNEVAKRLDTEGRARFFCLSGIGARLGSMVSSVQEADRVLVVDGCSVGCGKFAVDGAGLVGYSYLVVTDCGIEKAHTFEWKQEDFDKALAACGKALAE